MDFHLFHDLDHEIRALIRLLVHVIMALYFARRSLLLCDYTEYFYITLSSEASGKPLKLELRVCYTLAVWRFKPILRASLHAHSYLSNGLRSRNYCEVG